MELLEVLLVATERVVKVLLHVLNVLLLRQLFTLELAIGCLQLFTKTDEGLPVLLAGLAVFLLLVVEVVHELVDLDHQAGLDAAPPEGEVLLHQLLLRLHLPELPALLAPSPSLLLLGAGINNIVVEVRGLGEGGVAGRLAVGGLIGGFEVGGIGASELIGVVLDERGDAHLATNVDPAVVLAETLILPRRPLLLVLLLQDHVEVGADLVEHFRVLQLLRQLSYIVELPVKPLLQEVHLLPPDVLTQHVDQLEPLPSLPHTRSRCSHSRRPLLPSQLLPRAYQRFSECPCQLLPLQAVLLVSFAEDGSQLLANLELQ